MRAWQYHAADKTLVLADLPVPTPGAGELLVRVSAAGVTPTELMWYPTTHDKAGGPRVGAVPGHEFSGVVAAIGDGASGFAVGDAVYGMSDWFADGATAEYCLTRPQHVAHKPQRLSDAEAAIVPIGALTAWQGLFDRAKLRAGERVLIQGGSGSVGGFAVQLAHDAGANVVTTASLKNAEYLRRLGADQVVDYRGSTPIPERFDVIFDAVGGDTLASSWDLLTPGGRLVTIAADSEHTQDDRIKASFFIVEPDAAQLARMASLIDNGNLAVAVKQTVAFTEADAAYLSPARSGGPGKTAILIAAR